MDKRRESITMRIARGTLCRWLAGVCRRMGRPVNMHVTYSLDRGLKMVVYPATDDAIEKAIDEVFQEHKHNPHAVIVEDKP